MAWDYAELSKAAKAAGGPEKLIEIISDAGRQSGHEEMIPLLFITLGIGVLGTLAVQKLKKIFGKDSKLSPAEVEAAKVELIQGIKEYDAAHPDEENVQNTEETPADDNRAD